MSELSVLRPSVQRDPSPNGDRLVRVAIILLALHAALSIFSAVALTTFLSGPPPAWLQRADSQRALSIGWRFGPALTVVLGALAALSHATGKLGIRKAFLMFAVAFVVSLCAELLGTSTGYPFGPYSYTPILGYRVGGLVPFSIPTSWFYMLYASITICGRIMRRDDSSSRNAQAWKWAFVSGLILTAWDVSMDPAMVKTSHWLWHLAPGENQSVIARVLFSDLFYGMPLSNWIGWIITGTIVARLMIAVVPTAEWKRIGSTSSFPFLLYLVNGILPIAICVRYGMNWATVFGTLAMILPVVMSFRSRWQIGVQSSVANPPKVTVSR